MGSRREQVWEAGQASRRAGRVKSQTAGRAAGQVGQATGRSARGSRAPFAAPLQLLPSPPQLLRSFFAPLRQLLRDVLGEAGRVRQGVIGRACLGKQGPLRRSSAAPPPSARGGRACSAGRPCRACLGAGCHPQLRSSSAAPPQPRWGAAPSSSLSFALMWSPSRPRLAWGRARFLNASRG